MKSVGEQSGRLKWAGIDEITYVVPVGGREYCVDQSLVACGDECEDGGVLTSQNSSTNSNEFVTVVEDHFNEQGVRFPEVRNLSSSELSSFDPLLLLCRCIGL